MDFWRHEKLTITLDATWIADASMDLYSVSVLDASGNVVTSGTITPTRYERFLIQVTPRLSLDGLLDSNGSLKSGYELYAALLVCDLIKSGKTIESGLKSESYGNSYSYTKSDAAATTNKTSYMLRYEAGLAELRKGVFASKGVHRADKEIEFAKLSQGDTPEVERHHHHYHHW